ncbi:ABC transporter substrate-binding protein [Gulosibacter sp. 10]|uniref:ABC transporter substrate-binding protein n=1 Tax=Gulosibacter sp. 10 TaxID=1255570 RepID=UPI00097F649C|nr:ABC transporter substrate-binding protein [Gulosibacter sp. 10]SJM58393.1 Petrobactin ABC transporter, periplasmic binding protein [Gulosibacter sp. 10]
MTILKRRGITAIAGLALAALALTGCAGTESAPGETEAAAESSAQYPLTVTDMAGNEVTIESADSVVVTDNRFFAVLEEWGVVPTAAPVSLMSPNNPYTENEEILDTGNHREPDLEQVVTADPDLIINGYRYDSHAEDIQNAAPDAAFVSMTGPEDQSLYEYTEQSLTLLGEIFGKQDEAAALVEELDTAIADAKEAYDPEMTVMGLVTSGNEINYSSPTEGRGASDYFDLLELTPALEAEGSSDHQGDEISIESIAEANADFFLVLDRDAAFDDEEYTPATQLITESAALANVPAVQNDAIYVMPGDYYLTEDVYAHIDVINGLAEAFSAAN